MAEPTQKAPKTVSEADFIAFKKGSEAREKRLKEELAELRDSLSQRDSELKIAKMDGEDDAEIQKVKDYLLKEEKRVNQERAKLDQDLASYEEREKEVRVKSLASQYQVELDTIKDADDPEKEALRLVAERLSKEKEELSKAPESLYESLTPGQVKKGVWDMTDAEFNKEWESKKRESSLAK